MVRYRESRCSAGDAVAAEILAGKRGSGVVLVENGVV
jgi:hypothetical protein